MSSKKDRLKKDDIIQKIREFLKCNSVPGTAITKSLVEKIYKLGDGTHGLSDKEKLENFLNDFLKMVNILQQHGLSLANAVRFAVDGASSAKAVGEFTNESFREWIEGKFTPNLIALSKEDYAKALLVSIPLALKLSPTDYGTSRQRDFAQVWTDTIRGTLGEIGFMKFMKTKFDLEIIGDYHIGELSEYLPTDIKVISEEGAPQDPAVKVSIKTIKLNGKWLDIPYNQLEHSDVFVCVKLAIPRHHLLSYLRTAGLLDKIIESVKESAVWDDREFSESEVKTVLESVPEFDNIVAYMAGYLTKEDCKKRGITVENSNTENGERFTFDGYWTVRENKKNGIIVPTITYSVTRYLGWWSENETKPILEEKVTEKVKTDPAVQQKLKERNLSIENVKIQTRFEVIDNFSKAQHFLASTNYLNQDWDRLKQLIVDGYKEGEV